MTTTKKTMYRLSKMKRKKMYKPYFVNAKKVSVRNLWFFQFSYYEKLKTGNQLSGQSIDKRTVRKDVFKNKDMYMFTFSM